MLNWMIAVRAIAGTARSDPPRVVRQLEVAPEEGERDDEGQDPECARDHAGGREDAQPVGEVVDRLQEKLVDEAVADVLAYLVVLVEGPDEELQDEDHDEVRERLPERKAADGRVRREDGPPEDEDDDQVEEPEHAADREVPAVDQVALQPDQEGSGRT
jgi:hypothetical protein